MAAAGSLTLAGERRVYVRPPGAAAEDQLYRKCLKCGACVEVCPSRGVEQLDLSLDLLNLGTPVLNPLKGGCLAWKRPCLECCRVCPTGTLKEPVSLNNISLGSAKIDATGCVNCMMCIMECPVPGTVLFPNPEGGPFRRAQDIPTQLSLKDSHHKPYIVRDKCVGCGICANICPPRVIKLIPPGGGGP